MTSKIRFRGATSGFVELAAPDAAGSNTLTLPTGNGTAGQYLQTSGTSGELSWQTVAESAEWVDGTAVSPTGTSSVTFSSIPSNAQAIFLTFDGLSWATTGGYLDIRLGTGGSDETTGYISKTSYLAAPSTISIGGDTAQFRVRIWQDAGTQIYGNLILINQTGNTWTLNGSLTNSQSDSMNNMAGRKTLSGVLDQITFLQSSGNNFDAGTVNIHYITT